MPGDLRHKAADRSLATQLTQAEFDKITAHHLESQATGDIIYASSGTQLEGLGIGTEGQPLTVAGGVPTWGGGQIAFPAVAVPSADPNTLDDYEEGTRSPVHTFTTPAHLNVDDSS